MKSGAVSKKDLRLMQAMAALFSAELQLEPSVNSDVPDSCQL